MAMGGMREQNHQAPFDNTNVPPIPGVQCRGQDVTGSTWSSCVGWILSGNSASIRGRLEPPALPFSAFSFARGSVAFTASLCGIFQGSAFGTGPKPKGQSEVRCLLEGC